jgi:hypothetical protein
MAKPLNCVTDYAICNLVLIFFHRVCIVTTVKRFQSGSHVHNVKITVTGGGAKQGVKLLSVILCNKVVTLTLVYVTTVHNKKVLVHCIILLRGHIARNCKIPTVGRI